MHPLQNLKSQSTNTIVYYYRTFVKQNFKHKL